MNRKRQIIICLIIFIMTGGIFTLSNTLNGWNSNILEAAENDDYMLVPLGPRVIKIPEGVEIKESPVAFNHSLHFDYRCQVCHHKWEGDETIPSCSTSDCHDQIKTPDVAEGQKISSEDRIKNFKIAYHQLCITCHKDVKAKNLDMELSLMPVEENISASPPTGCTECHPKD